MARLSFATLATASAAVTVACLPEPACARSLTGEMDALSMFANAVPMVKAVMLLLIVASIVSWALLVVKTREISAGIRAARDAIKTIRAADDLDGVRNVDAGTADMVEAARLEIEKSDVLLRQGRIDGVRERIEDQLVRIEHGIIARMRQGLPVLASVGSVAPFVGLFGTVWGIMHSFVGIADAKSTSLAVVAPGIAEALLATALGLVAAIPATIMYNYLGRQMALYRQVLGDSATLLGCLVGRELELSHAAEPSTVREFQKRSN